MTKSISCEARIYLTEHTEVGGSFFLSVGMLGWMVSSDRLTRGLGFGRCSSYIGKGFVFLFVF